MHEVYKYLPNLTHLCLKHKMTENESLDELFDGSWWESTIKKSTPSLKSFIFEFDSNDCHKVEATLDKMNSIMAPFQTKFWLVEKRWFVNLILSAKNGMRLFTREFARRINEMTDVDSSLKTSTDQSFLAIQEKTITELTVNYSCVRPSPTSLRFGSQILDLYIRNSIPSSKVQSEFLSLKNDIRPYVDFCNVQRLRAQQKKAVDLLKNQILVLKVVEPTNWWFWRDRPTIDAFCRIFSNLKQLDLGVYHHQVMTIIVDNLLNLEEAIFRFNEDVEQILLENKNFGLCKTRLRSFNWSF
jgi:hypothetical protein